MLNISEGMFEFGHFPKGLRVGLHQEQAALIVHAQKMAVHMKRRTPANLGCAPFLCAVIQFNTLEMTSVLVALAGIAIDESVDYDGIRVVRGDNLAGPDSLCCSRM